MVGRAGLVCLLCLAVLAGSTAGVAGATTFPVVDAATFYAALDAAQPGDTIEFAPGTYSSELVIADRHYDGPPLVLVGPREAKLWRLSVRRSSNFVLRGVSIAPPNRAAAWVQVEEGSSDIVFDDVLVDGREEFVGARIETDPGTSRITVQDSEFTQCGHKDRCLAPHASDLLVQRNVFHDCVGCDFIRGGADRATLIGNSFDRAVPGKCLETGKKCPHSNHIHMMSGGPWTIVGNRFGDIDGGPAQLWLGPVGEEPVHDVLIASNIFTGHLGTAVRLSGGNAGPGPPLRVRIVNNTILSGLVTAITLISQLNQLPVEDQPVIANNVLDKQGKNQCSKGLWVSNLASNGKACADGQLGPANLDGAGLPTASSDLVIDRADPAYAPELDFFGNPRIGLPDRGAFEYSPPPSQADLALTQADSPDPVEVGALLTYTIDVVNEGPDLAANVVVTDDLPDGVVFVSASAECTEASGMVTCDLGGLDSGSRAQVTVSVVPMAAGELSNVASVTSATADPDASDNSETESTQVDEPPPD